MSMTIEQLLFLEQAIEKIKSAIKATKKNEK